MKYLGNPQSGSQAGTTASHNAFGQYLRNRRKPTNPNTSHQVAVRSILGQLAKAWKFLTDLQRAAWKSLAIATPRTDSLGQTIKLSGFQEYISVNAKRGSFGDTTINDPPVDPVIESLGSVTLTTTGGLQKVNFGTAFSTGSLTKVGIFASSPRSAGVTFVGDLRLIEVTGAHPVSPLDISANYTARFGGVPVGDRVFVMVEAYNAGLVNSAGITSSIQS